MTEGADTPIRGRSPNLDLEPIPRPGPSESPIYPGTGTGPGPGVPLCTPSRATSMPESGGSSPSPSPTSSDLPESGAPGIIPVPGRPRFARIGDQAAVPLSLTDSEERHCALSHRDAAHMRPAAAGHRLERRLQVPAAANYSPHRRGSAGHWQWPEARWWLMPHSLRRTFEAPSRGGGGGGGGGLD